MSASGLQNILIVYTALIILLVFLVLATALFTSFLFLCRSRIRHQRHVEDWHWRYLNGLEQRMHRVEDDVDILHVRARRALVHRLAHMVARDYQIPFEGPVFERYPHEIHNLDGQDERQLDSDDEQTPVIRNAAARRSLDFAEATDPRSYGINMAPSTCSDDDENVTQCSAVHQFHAYVGSLSGSTLCDEAEQRPPYLRGGYYQERCPNHFGHYDFNDDEDPHPHLPHAHWIENEQSMVDEQITVTTTTATQSASINAATETVPSFSANVTAMAPGITVVGTKSPTTPPSSASIQEAENFSPDVSDAVFQNNDEVSVENRIPIPRSRRAQIVEMSRGLNMTHVRQGEQGVENRGVIREMSPSTSSMPSLWTPPPSNRGTEGASLIEGNALLLRYLREGDAARLHSTPEQWPRNASDVIEADVLDEEPERDFSVPRYQYEFAQAQANEFVRQYPHLARQYRGHGRGASMRGGSRDDIPSGQGHETNVEKAHLLDETQCYQAEPKERLPAKTEGVTNCSNAQFAESLEHGSYYMEAQQHYGSQAAGTAQKYLSTHPDQPHGALHQNNCEDAELVRKHYEANPCEPDETARLHARESLDAEALYHDALRTNPQIWSPQDLSGLNRDFGYQHCIEVEDDISRGYRFSVQSDQFLAEDHQIQEDDCARSRCLQRQHEHVLEALDAPLIQPSHSRQIQHSTCYNSEDQTFGSYCGDDEVNQEAVMASLTSQECPPFIRGGADETGENDDNTIFQSPDYDPVAVSRAIAKLNKELAEATKRMVASPAEHDHATTLQHKIAWLKRQRASAEGSAHRTSLLGAHRSTRIAGMRGGAIEDVDSVEDDEFQVRHPGFSNGIQDTATPALLDLERETARMEMLMGKAQKLPDGDQTNWEILVQLQRMIDQLEAERNAAQILGAAKETCYASSGNDGGEGRLGLGGNTTGSDSKGSQQELDDLVFGCDTIPSIPPRNPARRTVKQLPIASRPTSSSVDPVEHSELKDLVKRIEKLDRSICCLENLILAEAENPKLNVEQTSFGTLALVKELERLSDLRSSLYSRARLLAPPPAHSWLAPRACDPRTTEARLRGGGLDQSAAGDEDREMGGGPAHPRGVPNIFTYTTAPPLPARDPARIDSETVSLASSDLDREIAALTQDLVRAGQHFVARLQQLTPSNYLASLEADAIERLVAQIKALQRQKAQLHSARQSDSATAPAAPESQPSNPHPSPSPAAPRSPYRILTCQDWTWPHPNWQFDNLPPAHKVSLLRERRAWLDRQTPIADEVAQIEADISRLVAYGGLERDPESYRDPVTPGFDGLGNWREGCVARGIVGVGMGVRVRCRGGSCEVVAGQGERCVERWTVMGGMLDMQCFCA